MDTSGRACRVGPDGKDFDDDNGGQTCAQVREADEKKKADLTVIGKKETNNDELFAAWWDGSLPSRIDYDESDPATKQMANSYNVKLKIRQYAQAGCPANFRLDVGHFSAAIESFDRYMISPPGYENPTQLQVGGHSGSISRGGDGNVNYEIRNGMTNSSFWALNTVSDTLGLGLRGAIDNRNGPSGPRHNVLQVFRWTGPNPCAAR